jgi:methionine synthase II (cobalamin-independent)
LNLFERITKKISNDRLYISPSCGLEFLPHENALMKLKRMVEVVKKFNQG